MIAAKLVTLGEVVISKGSLLQNYNQYYASDALQPYNQYPLDAIISGHIRYGFNDNHYNTETSTILCFHQAFTTIILLQALFSIIIAFFHLNSEPTKALSMKNWFLRWRICLVRYHFISIFFIIVVEGYVDKKQWQQDEIQASNKIMIVKILSKKHQW